MSRDGTIARTEGGGYVLRYERIFPKSRAEVWAALTEPSVLSRWLSSKVEVDLQVGGRFVIHFFEGLETMNGVILAFEPEQFIEYSWVENGAPPSRVRWSLEAQEDACRLTLAHHLPPGSTPELVIELGGGWHGLVGFLEASLDGERPSYDEGKRRELEAHYGEIYRREFGG